MKRSVTIGSATLSVLLALAPEVRGEAPLWTPLFNGQDLSGWDVVLSGHDVNDDPERIVQVEGDSVHIYKDAPDQSEQPFGYLRSRATYSHYRIRFQYRWGDKRYSTRATSVRDAGLLYHVTDLPSSHGIWPTSVECQVQECDTGDLITVDTRCTSYVDPATAAAEYPTFRDAAAGGVTHPNRWYVNASRTLDRLEGWNDVEVVVCGAEGAVHIVNGHVNQRLQNIEQPKDDGWEPLTEGKVALQIEGAEIFYRRVQICRLTPAAARAALEHPAASPVESAAEEVLPRAGKTGLDAISVPAGFRVELVADSNLVQHPMMACLDEQGRIYLSESDGVNREKVDQLLSERGHRALQLEDQDGDGVYDKRSMFADGLVLPNGAEWHAGALYLCSAPYLWRFKDQDGDGRSDVAERIAGKFNFDGMSSTFHGPVFAPDGRLYWSGGQWGWRLEQYPSDPSAQPPSGAKGPDADLAGPWTTMAPGAFSCWPDGSDPENLAYGGRNNPVETAFTEEGEVFGTVSVYDHLDGRRRDAVVHWIDGGVFNLDERNYAGLIRTGPDLTPLSYRGHVAPAGITRYRDAAFGEAYRNNFFFAEFNTHRVYRLIVERDGATYRSRDEVFVESSDPDCHFTDVFQDADGSLLVLDTGGWFRHGCPTSQIAKPTILGAIYRVSKIGSPPIDDARGAKIDWSALEPSDLTQLLSDARFVVRDRAIEELANRGQASLEPLRACFKGGSPAARIQCVWALTRMRATGAELVREALQDEDAPVLIAACHSAGVSRDQSAAPALIKLLGHQDAAVRREAATALGRLGSREAVQPLLEAVRLGGGRFGEHAITYALIRIADGDATVAGLRDASPDVQRIALIALDQMKSPRLTRDTLAATLDSRDKALSDSAMDVLQRHPEWGGEIAEWLKQTISQTRFTDATKASLRGAIRAFHGDPTVQSLVGRTLTDASAPQGARLLALEAVGLIDETRLPSAWLDGLAACLSSKAPELKSQAIAVVAERQIPNFTSALTALAESESELPSIRIAAAGAALATSASAPESLFRYLLETSSSAPASYDRLASAQALAKGKLSSRQLAAVAEAAKTAGPLELPALLQCFADNRDDSVGLQLVKSLEQSPGLSSQSPDIVRVAFASYSDAVRQASTTLLTNFATVAEGRDEQMRRLATEIVDGDARRGRDVFFGQRAACASCHRLGADGGNVGPNLTDIGRIRTSRDLIESIVFPSASFAREYEPYTIVTNEGKAYNGVVSRRTVDAIYLRGADRGEIRLALDDIEQMTPASVSLMPQGLDRVLTKDELRDVVAFLSSQK